jgi:hypothetical protein
MTVFATARIGCVPCRILDAIPGTALSIWGCAWWAYRVQKRPGGWERMNKWNKSRFKTIVCMVVLDMELIDRIGLCRVVPTGEFDGFDDWLCVVLMEEEEET